MVVKILTLNVNGLNNEAKRRNVMRYCEIKNCDVYLIQETHCCEKNVEKWSKEWRNLTKGKSLWNNGSHRERGVAFLTKNDIEIKEITQDKRGRILAANFCKKEKEIWIINAYGPHDPQKKENLSKTLENHARKCDTFILSGDFNMVLNPTLDRQGGDCFNKNNTLGEKKLRKFY